MERYAVQNPKITIIIPVFNVEEHLRRCLDSIVDQSLHEIEVICIDDASTDGSLSILKEYEQKDDRIRIIEFETNKSAHLARMEGVQAATGEYIWFVDADDDIEKMACENLYKKMSKVSVDILHFGTDVINKDNLPAERVASMQKFTEPYRGELRGKDVFEGCFMNKKYNFSIWNKLFRTSLCKKAFSKMKTESYPKAQDKYEYFVMSFFAESYLGAPDMILYNYHFGTGITGHGDLTIESFERYCTMSFVSEAIREFLLEFDVSGMYSGVYNISKNQLLNDCFGNWSRNVSDINKGACFDLMIKYWGNSTVISKIAEKNWYGHGQIAKYLLKSESIVCPKRRIKTIATYYHSFVNGGVQRVMGELMHLWSSLGYNVILITDTPPTDNDYPLPQGVKRIVIRTPHTIDRDDYINRAKDLEDILKDNSVDAMVYHAWLSNVLLWDMLICKTNGVSFITHSHNVFSILARNTRMYFSALPDVYRLCDSVITLSAVDTMFWSNFNENIFEVINPFTFDLNSAQRSELNNKNILWLGRISEEKRPLDSIKIFKEVQNVVPDARLLIVGTGSENIEKSMKSLIEEEKLENSITMCGFSNDVLPYYQSASIFLCTSEYEGFPLTLIESKSAGVPCVMYELPYLTLTRENKGIVQVAQDDVSHAAMEIIKLLEDDEYRIQMGKDARDSIIQHSSYDFASVWQSIFDSVEKPYIPIVKEDTNRIMWDTLMSHYRTGSSRINTKLSLAEKKNKELNTKVLNLEKRLGKCSEEEVRKRIDNEVQFIKNSWTYRLGELITFLPRYLRGDLKKK